MNESLATLEQRVVALEAQLAALTAPLSTQTSATRIIAPVEVVDTEGQLLLTIQRERNSTNVSLYNATGHAVAILGVDGTHAGFLAIRNAEGITVGYLDVETSGARLILHDHARKGGVVVFGGDSGDDNGGGINLLHTAGGLSITLWSDTDGGKLVIYNGQEQEEELLTLPQSSSSP
jgi:hypothetical protein